METSLHEHDDVMDGQRATMFEQAARENADGVVHLRQGDAVSASQAFMAALTTLSKFRQYLHQVGGQQYLPNDPPLSCAADARRYRCCKAFTVPYLEDKGFFIYSNAVVFSRRPDIGKDVKTSSRISQTDTVAFCEAVALFNLSLVYHQRGKHFGEDRALLGALDLYEQSLATLLNINKTVNSDEVNVLKLVVLNNRINILNEIANYPSAQALVNDILLQSVNALSACRGTNGSSLSFLTKSDIDNFLLNALVIRRFNSAPCA